MHKIELPLIVPAEGIAVTVTVVVVVHPLVFMYVITEVPALSPLTTPLFETVATPRLAELHGVVP